MGTYKEIKVIMLYTLNNAEYLAYMNAVLNLLPPPPEDRPEIESLDENLLSKGAPAIGLSAKFVNTFEKDLLALADVVEESRTAQETEAAAVHEKTATIWLFTLPRVSHVPEASRLKQKEMPANIFTKS